MKHPAQIRDPRWARAFAPGPGAAPEAAEPAAGAGQGRLSPGIFDAAVVGGGPAGAVTALELARGGRRVLVLDRASDRHLRTGEVLPAAANPLLHRLGLVEGLESLPHLRSSGRQSAWGSPHLAEEDDRDSPHGRGWHVGRGDAEGLLLELAESAGAEVHRRARLGVVRRASGGWTFTWLSDGAPGRAAFARYMIDASGQSRGFLRRHGVPVDRHDRLTAWIATFTAGTGDRDARSLVEAEADGWWFTARLPERRRMAVLFGDGDPAPHGDAGIRDAFLARLSRTRFVRARILDHGYALAADPRSLAIDVSRPRRVAGERWLAVGDAAGRLDAAASHGMTAALAAGERAARAVDRDLAGDPGERDAYARDAARLFDDHLARRRRIYARERRWAERGFWSRRRVTAAPPASAPPARRPSISSR